MAAGVRIRGAGCEGGGRREGGGGYLHCRYVHILRSVVKNETMFWSITQNQRVCKVRGRTFFMSGFTSPLARRSAADAAETVRMLG
jgi:hypothetical protein